ncbi:hypothetical protein Tco_0190502 [Tanacetum coccineum]
MKRGFRGVPRPLLPAMLPVVAVDQSAGQADQAVDQPSPSEPLPSSSHPYPHVAEERTMTVDDLLQLVPKLIIKVDSLETELKQTKLTMGKALVKLVKKGRNLQEEGLDEMVRNMMKDKSEVFKTPTQGKTSGEEDISPTTLEAAKTLSKVASQRSKSVDKGKRYKRRKESKGKDIDTGFEDISTGFEDISTGFEEVNTGGLGVSTGSVTSCSAKAKGMEKAPMIVEETQAPKITKEQIQQEEASLAEAIRLQTLEEEETAKQVHLDALLAKRLAEEEELTEQQKKRKAQVQFEAQFYTEEDWDAIRAKLEANAELTKDVLGKDLSEQDFAKRMNLHVKLSEESRNLEAFSVEEIKEEFEKLVKQINTFVPINIEATKAQLKRYGEELQTEISKKQRIDDKDVSDTEEKVETDKEESVEAMNPTPLDTKSNIVANWKIFQQGKRSIYQIIRANRADTVYMSFGAMLKDFTRDDLIKLYRKYPLSKDVCQVMLKMKLLDGKMNEVCYKLLKMIEKQAGVKK